MTTAGGSGDGGGVHMREVAVGGNDVVRWLLYRES